jgi:hypothetical protein
MAASIVSADQLHFFATLTFLDDKKTPDRSRAPVTAALTLRIDGDAAVFEHARRVHSVVWNEQARVDLRHHVHVSLSVLLPHHRLGMPSLDVALASEVTPAELTAVASTDAVTQTVTKPMQLVAGNGVMGTATLTFRRAKAETTIDGLTIELDRDDVDVWVRAWQLYLHPLPV